MRSAIGWPSEGTRAGRSLGEMRWRSTNKAGEWGVHAHESGSGEGAGGGGIGEGAGRGSGEYGSGGTGRAAMVSTVAYAGSRQGEAAEAAAEAAVDPLPRSSLSSHLRGSSLFLSSNEG